MNKEIYDSYISHGFYLGELDGNSKQPKHARIKNNSCKHEKPTTSVKYHKDTLYFSVPPTGIIVIDVDVKNGKRGKESYLKLLNDLGYEEWEVEPSVKTGSGGFHVYAYCDKPVKSIQKKYPDIDFQSWNINPDKCTKFSVAGGQVIEYNSKPYVYEMLTDEVVVNRLNGLSNLLEVQQLHISKEVNKDVIGFGNLDDNTDCDVLQPDKKTPDEVKEYLKYCNASVPYDGGWMQTCSAIQRELGKTDEAYEIFRAWSETGDNYDEEACITKWNNVGSADNGWSMGSVIKSAREGKLHVYTNRIKAAETVDEIESILSEKDWGTYPTIQDADVEEMAKLVKSKYKELNNSTLNIQSARKLVKPLKVLTSESSCEVDWLKTIVYVDSFNSTKYYLTDTFERLSADGVNGRFSKKLNDYKNKNGVKGQITIQQLTKMGLITVCSSHEYNPLQEDLIFKNKHGALTLNLFKSNSRPKPALEYTPEGTVLINKFVNHIHNLMLESEANILLDWLAYCAQNFGKKILWTPLIQSAEGLGKSVIGNLMINHVFGKDNSGTADSNVIISAQTSWATTGVFKVLEEIKLAGHNRFEVLNQLKPYITNETVSRVEKYETSVEVRNFINFIAFTNFKDAIPLTADDRRWWIVFSKQNSIDELERYVGMDRYSYFKPLHDLSKPESEYGAEFHKYLLERDISGFEPNFAPISIHKERMRATEDSKTDNLSELEHIINQQSKGVTTEILSTKQLRKLTQSIGWEGNSLNDNEIAALLRKLNFMKFPSKIKHDGEVHNVWFSNAGLSDKEVRLKFHDAMMLEEVVDDFINLDAEF